MRKNQIEIGSFEMDKLEISIVVITFNEELNIERCLESVVPLGAEMIVVDSFSTDRTKNICEQYDVRFYEREFEGHVEQKNYALNLATHPMVLSLDADEALTSELRASIIEEIKNNEYDAWELRRLTSYCGQWIRHGGWYPDRKIRLWKNSMGKWGGQNPHDKVILDQNAKVGRLNGDLLHHSFYSISEHVEQIQKFTTIAARSGYKNGRKTYLLKIILGPIFRFFSMYLIKLGFLDGYHGLIIAINSSFYKFLKEIKLRELQRKV